MTSYLIPIQTALFIFPFLAALLTIPYIIHQYRKYGATLPIRISIVFSFIFYVLCCYLLVSLPLPPIEEVAHYTQPVTQLIPFASIRDISLTTTLIWDDPSTYLTALNEPSILQVIFNIVMTIPFGIYLRYYFTYSCKKTILLTFILSLSFECLQLSGLCFIYPRPYRIFDVDDLLTNTLGGMIGYVITPLLVHFLPARKTLDEESYKKGAQVSAPRRVLAFIIDLFILTISFISIIIFIKNRLYYIFLYVTLFCIFFLIIPLLTHGQTLGKKCVNIRLIHFDTGLPKWYHYLLHFLPIYIIILPSPWYLLIFIAMFAESQVPILYIWYVLFSMYITYYIICLLNVMPSLLQSKKTNMHKRLSILKNISTIMNSAITKSE